MSKKVKKILEEVHPLHIIREVHKWPALYARDSTERGNVHFKFKIWSEIAKTLFAEWDAYSKIEKHNKISDLKKKWRNLRDTFKREVEVERKIREGQSIKKKTYVYYKHMAFLRPHILPSDSEDEPAGSGPRRRRPSSAPAADAPVSDDAAPSVAVSLGEREEIDEDKHFVMSLIPSLKKMTEDEKLTAKVKILKVIKGIRSSSRSSSFNYRMVDSLANNTELEGRDNVEIKKEMLNEAESVDNDYEVRDSDDEDSS